MPLARVFYLFFFLCKSFKDFQGINLFYFNINTIQKRKLHYTIVLAQSIVISIGIKILYSRPVTAKLHYLRFFFCFLTFITILFRPSKI